MEWISEFLNSEYINHRFTQTLLIGLSVILIVIFYVIFRSMHSYWKFHTVFRKLPGPKGHLFWGNMDKYMPSEEGIINIGKYILENPDKKVIRMSVGPFMNFVLFNYPEEVGKLLCMKRNELPKNELLYGLLRQYLGDGLLISNYDKWQYRRKLLTPAFHYDILIPYVSLYNDAVDVFIEKCDRQIENGQDWIGIFDTVTLLTLDNMLKCVCSYQSDCQFKQEDDEYVSAIKINADLARKQIFFLPYQIKPIFYLSPDGARWRKNCKIVREHALKVILHRRECILSEQGTVEEKPYKDFIDILLTARDGEGNGLTNEDIVEEMTTFIFRGHDTTASGISWTLYLLAAHPNYQDMCRKEIRDILSDRQSNRIQWEDLPRLSLLSMCIKESQRLFPPVIDVYRTNNEEISVHGYKIPQGSNLVIGISSLHRNPHVWENPHEFNPMRFDCDLPGGHPFAFIPFSAGHRNCIGQKFAFNEELVTIARVINHYNLELITKQFRRVPVVILKPEEDIRIKLSK